MIVVPIPNVKSVEFWHHEFLTSILDLFLLTFFEKVVKSS